MNIVRYAKIDQSYEKREIVLLKGQPCRWGKCTFCTYIEDNATDIEAMNELNMKILDQVTGEFGALMVINSGSCFELPEKTIARIIKLSQEKKIESLFFEAHWMYRKQLEAFRHQFKNKVYFITGIETFNDNFRNRVLKKGISFKNFEEIKKYFQSICIMVGIKGQTKEMIKTDVDMAVENFDRVTFNLYIENGSTIKPDYDLQKWFCENFSWLKNKKGVDVLVKNTDFGVGAENE